MAPLASPNMQQRQRSGRPLVSAVMIVRDEADFLRSCLTSIASFCDEIVVVDTGSVDSSVEVAESFGAVVGYRPWDDDFAAARNVALELATGEWVLYIDADEQLEDVDAEAARAELVAASNAVALRVRFRASPLYSPYREYRLWRHRPDIRFRGRIHESMLEDLRRIESEEGLPIADSSTVQICHYGYEGDQTHKHRRNLPMLERQVIDVPTRCYLWNHLATVRAALGDVAGAEDAWQRGIDVIRTLGIADRTDVLCFGSYALHLVSRGVDAQDTIDELLELAPWYLVGHWAAARNHRACERYAASIPHLRTLLDVGPDPVDATLAYHNAMLTDWAWDDLGDSLFRVGDSHGAAEVYRLAQRERPQDRSFAAKAIAMSSHAARRGARDPVQT
jgi:tetratricopeptide (TPR) repeat protein